MKRKSFCLSGMIALLIVSRAGSIVQGAQTAKVDVTGVWTFTVESAAGTGTPTLTFKQNGEQLTGHYSSTLVGEAELTGTVKGQTIDFTVTADVQGVKFQLKYTGTIENKDSMKGKLSNAEFGDGTFVGTRK